MPRTKPVTRTVATLGSLEDHSIARPKSALPVESVSVALRVAVSPTARLTGAGGTVTAFTGTRGTVTAVLAGSAGVRGAVGGIGREMSGFARGGYRACRAPA